jgi:hypothetical protein
VGLNHAGFNTATSFSVSPILPTQKDRHLPVAEGAARRSGGTDDLLHYGELNPACPDKGRELTHVMTRADD